MQLTIFWNRATAEKMRMFREDKSHLQFCHVLPNVPTHVSTHTQKCDRALAMTRKEHKTMKKGQDRKGGCKSGVMWSFWQNQIGIRVNHHRLGSARLCPPHPPITPWTSPLGSGISPDMLTHTTQPGHTRLTCTVTLLLILFNNIRVKERCVNACDTYTCCLLQSSATEMLFTF